MKMPKRMSFFWSGRMTWLRYLTLASFKALNPDWEIRLYSPPHDLGNKTWRTPEKDDTEYHGEDYRQFLHFLDIEPIAWEPPIPNLPAAHASDILEWEVLANEGGFYSDMDIFYVRPMTHLTPQFDSDRAEALMCWSRGFVTIGFFGSAGNNPVFAYFGEQARQNYNAQQYQTTGANLFYNLAELKNWNAMKRPGDQVIAPLRSRFPQTQIDFLPENAIYPFSWREMRFLWNERHDLPQETVGVHWFGGEMTSQAWNMMLMTEERWREYDNTFTRLLRPMIENEKTLTCTHA